MSTSKCRIPRGDADANYGTPIPSVHSGGGEMTEEQACAADESILGILREAQDIISHRSTATPTREHLEALWLSLEFYKAKSRELEEHLYPAQQLHDYRKGQLVHVPELESNCYQTQCAARAEYVLIGLIMPVLLCPLHAKQLPQWKGLRMPESVQ